MHPRNLQIKDFNYELPEEKIAKFPLQERDESKLLILKNGEIETGIYKNIDHWLPENALLIFNKTKVVEARLLFQKPSGGIIEIFCLEPTDQYHDITSAMMQQGMVYWKCLVGGASKWKHGMQLTKTIECHDYRVILKAEIEERLSDSFIIKMQWEPAHLSFAELLHQAGLIPLPPYLHRKVEASDKERYQTIYAAADGSVAAPTAGLHFTQHVFEKLEQKKIKKEFVTLHVGAGTFKPVKSEYIAGHEMHSEFIEVDKEQIQQLINHIDKTIVAVGTTSLRTIESLYWMGLTVIKNPGINMSDLIIHQWDAYDEIFEAIEPKLALHQLLTWMTNLNLEKIITKTQILIAPGYQLKIVHAIITNFHQPQSTLLLLIAAIAGEQWKDMYRFALENDYRFLSYGDGCLIFNSQ